MIYKLYDCKNITYHYKKTILFQLHRTEDFLYRNYLKRRRKLSEDR